MGRPLYIDIITMYILKETVNILGSPVQYIIMKKNEAVGYTQYELWEVGTNNYYWYDEWQIQKQWELIWFKV